MRKHLPPLALLSAVALTGATMSRFKQQVQSQLAKLSDAQVLGVLTAANDGELDAGHLAQTKAVDPQVKGFADHMIADHSASNTEIGALARKLNISPQTSSDSVSLTQTAKSEKDVLSGLQGATFDQAYIDRMVADHQDLLDTIDRTLIPSASSADLKTLLQQTRNVVSEHLQAARTLQGQLGGKR